MINEGIRHSLRDINSERKLISVNSGLEDRSPEKKLKPAPRISTASRIRRVVAAGGAVGLAIGIPSSVGMRLLYGEQKKDCNPVTHTVQAGETLWDIAEEVFPNKHTGRAVHEIYNANGLESSVIQPGDNIEIPC